MELNINISQNQSVHEKIKKIIGLTNLDALYLTEKEIENIFEFTMLIDSCSVLNVSGVCNVQFQGQGCLPNLPEILS